MQDLYIKKTYYNDISVTYYRNGFKCLSKLKNECLIKRKYYGYTTKQCLKLFKEYYNNQ